MNGSTTPSILSSTTCGELACAPAFGTASARPASTIPNGASRRRMTFTSCHHPTHHDAYPVRVRAPLVAVVCLIVLGCGSSASAGAAEPPFEGSVARIDAATRALMVGSSWHPGCPVPIRALRLLRVTYVAFDGEPHHGRLVVNRR